jgi:hypothetical protein
MPHHGTRMPWHRAGFLERRARGIPERIADHVSMKKRKLARLEPVPNSP